MVDVKSDKWLYGLLGLLSLFLLVAALGGGLWHQEGWWGGQWQHQAFASLCHQDPARSFWLGGQPMAVCSRCLGIYAGLFAGFLAAPVFISGSWLKGRAGRYALVFLAGLNLLDVFGNILGFWQNTLASRFVLGLLAGMAVLIVLGWGLLTTPTQKKKGINHGTA